jgi:hypothetical protein
MRELFESVFFFTLESPPHSSEKSLVSPLLERKEEKPIDRL